YRQKLSDLIRRINGPETQILSTDWQGSRPPRKPLIHRIPLWVFISTICVLLMLIYFIIIYRVNKESDEVVARIDHIAEKEPILPSTPQMPQEQPKPSVPQIPQEHSKPSVPQIPQEQYISIPSENTVEEVLPETNSIPSTDDSNYSSTTNNNILDAERFREVFSKEIDEGKLAVLDGPTLRIINAFGPGNNRIKDDFIPMLSTLSKMLSATDSRILVVGHTDNQPVFSGHYPSNWHLSEARAKSVATHLADSEEMVERIRFEGHGDSEPVVDNDTEEHRALNRRIDIHIR
ncbi:MAG: OmpA family protein, partial [Desulfobacteraceae bacterium]